MIVVSPSTRTLSVGPTTRLLPTTFPKKEVQCLRPRDFWNTVRRAYATSRGLGSHKTLSLPCSNKRFGDVMASRGVLFALMSRGAPLAPTRLQ